MIPLTRRRGLAAGLVAATAVGLTACGSADQQVAGEPEAPAEPVSLTMTVWTANEDQLAMFQQIADAYVTAHPDLVADVSFEAIPFEDYTTSLTTRLAGGNPPDLAWILESYAPEFVQSGALVDVAPTLQAAEGYDYDDLVESSLSLWEQDGGLFAYPFSNSPFAMFVNTDQIEAAGQPSPAELVASESWTYDAAREIATAAAAESGKQGLVVRDFEYQVWENLSTVWEGWDAAPWSEDGTQCTFTDPEMVAAMSWIHEATFVDGALPGPGTTADFFAGDAAMTITQISRASALDDSFAWDLLPLPAGPEGRQNVIGQAGIGVFAQGANPEVAADFLAWFTNPENAEQLATYFPPPRESLLTAEVLGAANPLLSEEQLQAVVVEGIQDAVTKPAHPRFARLQETVRIGLDDLWSAGADVESVLAEVCASIDPILAD
ncbi:ABC transporter substrate-binding protein [Actinotalea sp. K2]|uniref:ABC transporter substrate-binding protein n=1 Tax=Actinotalea sp. K2 TaxID=2939438 RepID=UPI0020174204|nr:sugar ABC transporter substrate-binding protein [Actinotalea sp. K2]MCL3859429.1 sugar ABC transporter substrate-binding protein [Actinotalea sp. K2]